MKSSGASNISAYELWNEPDGTWNTSAAGSFDSGWTTTYKEVRSKDSHTPIRGPEPLALEPELVQHFLSDAKAAGTLPDIVSWHELGGPRDPRRRRRLPALEESLGISPRPIAIEEYGTRPPRSACPARWPATSPSSSGSGSTTRNWPSGTSPAHSATCSRPGRQPERRLLALRLVRRDDRQHGHHHAARRPGRRRVGDLVGNQVSVSFRRRQRGDRGHRQRTRAPCPAFGSTVTRQARVHALARPAHRAVSGPITISQSTYTVVNGSITVPVASMNSAYGYHLVVTPAAAPPRWPARTRSRTSTAASRWTPRTPAPPRARSPTRPPPDPAAPSPGISSPRAPGSTRSRTWRAVCCSASTP